MLFRAVRATMSRLAVFLALLVVSGATYSQDATQNAPEPATPPQQVQLLLDLLRDPAVQQWLAAQPKVGEAAPAAEQPAPAQKTAGGYFAHRLEVLRGNLALLGTTFPLLPGELERARIILSLEFQEHGLWSAPAADRDFRRRRLRLRLGLLVADHRVPQLDHRQRDPRPSATGCAR